MGQALLSCLLLSSGSRFLCLLLSWGSVDGFKIALDWKGANAMHPCWKHWIVIKEDANLPDADFVEVTCCDPTLFKKTKARDHVRHMTLLIEAKKRLDDGRITHGVFDDLEKSCGLNRNPRGLLADKLLMSRMDVRNAVYVDWVHTGLQDCTMNHEMTALLHALPRVG